MPAPSRVRSSNTRGLVEIANGSVASIEEKFVNCVKLQRMKRTKRGWLNITIFVYGIRTVIIAVTAARGPCMQRTIIFGHVQLLFQGDHGCNVEGNSLDDPNETKTVHPRRRDHFHGVQNVGDSPDRRFACFVLALAADDVY
ncbi:unnamed protein product [Linum trigynum]|uniref:Uncharacterized protein n=1 Tax=Linum trigynum TaxID=586398 RepID=A0AAV2GI81_9ROSI